MPTSSTAKPTPIRRTHAIHRSAACNRSARTGLTRTALLDPLERPDGVLAQELVVALGVRSNRVTFGVAADVARGDERVAAQPAHVVARDVEPVETAHELVAFRLEPLDERNVRARIL